MCGLTGFIDFTKKNNKSILELMTDELYHRGPDDSGYEFFEEKEYNLGFGHKRLSILDLSKHGHQPMQYKNFLIVYNGEVYNFKEIREELLVLGYEFFSDSDTEVILKSFNEWGTEFVLKFRGMFAISIYDITKKKLFIFRDRIGVKPLYYQCTDEFFIFASELKSFNKFIGFKKKISTNALSIFLQFGSIHAPKTIYENVYKLKPGHFIEYDLERNFFSEIEYWSIEKFYTDKPELTYEKAKDRLEELLIDSFSLRMVSDVPVGTFLSGGIDSSLVTAILQKNSKNPIQTFTIGFDDETFNEAPYAKKIADYLGTNHTEYKCKKDDALNIIPKLAMMYDEPFADSSAIPTTLVSKLAKEKVSVILSGDGGDELFCGYKAYDLVDNRLKQIKKNPLL